MNMATEKQNKLLKKKNSKSKTNTSEMAHIMKGWHSAVYHKSVFTLSNDLANENTQPETMCRICQSTDDCIDNQQVTPCSCIGSLQFVHMMCLQQWRKTKQAKGLDVSVCELCKQPYNIELLGSTDVQPDHIAKLQEDLRQLVKSGVYLMLMVRSLKSDVASAQSELNRMGSEHTSTSSNMARQNNQRINFPSNPITSDLSPQLSDSDDNTEFVSRRDIKQRYERFVQEQQK